jgi:hypothetical protein
MVNIRRQSEGFREEISTEPARQKKFFPKYDAIDQVQNSRQAKTRIDPQSFVWRVKVRMNMQGIEKMIKYKATNAGIQYMKVPGYPHL